MIVLTTDTFPGREVEPLGMVRGSTVRAKHIGSDIVAGLRNLVGGEVKEYAALLAGAREQAMDRMIAEARGLGADAIIAARLETSTIAQAASEILAYGTAVKFR
ncbi:YbjQ family protein [Maritimibacter alexandrii]|uniref:YbjQ family protein n=1 Tax=Maritimibacter alexandrii TaxID=2570355 RepID=UPI0011081D96|nr:YbjQ family protein [Maritimibacter alexandrii]